MTQGNFDSLKAESVELEFSCLPLPLFFDFVPAPFPVFRHTTDVAESTTTSFQKPSLDPIARFRWGGVSGCISGIRYLANRLVGVGIGLVWVVPVLCQGVCIYGFGFGCIFPLYLLYLLYFIYFFPFVFLRRPISGLLSMLLSTYLPRYAKFFTRRYLVCCETLCMYVVLLLAYIHAKRKNYWGRVWEYLP
ncbi:uncharacterized protein BDW43DRAFT_261165 [Aspergillus alliaceus]|uniref:uncharacterized protein n=1 Tax=Petromyces alliaceus TaxID=209559 RepID=UPI0012A72771|nr:uncharacterized protein BDW43DRAFT_261165 [Aspergillus alliaceus]KAB8239268.1 hypothetical protein BDW43DRAFT_261165 [Aspergillus alliaceus]